MELGTMKMQSLSNFGTLIVEIICQLVDQPEAVSVVETIEEQLTLLEIHASPADRGKIIGRSGELVDAIRQLAACRSGMEAHSYRVCLLEELTASPRAVSPMPSPSVPSVEAQLSLLIRVIQTVVDDPEQVVVHPLHSARTTVFEVSVAKGDIRKLVGRHGKTVLALRRLLKSFGTRTDRRYLLEVVEG
jgi:predicted RNA-binding protein YlqC (UPF0109 family)